MMMGMVELEYMLTKGLHTLNAKISLYLFPMFLNLYFYVQDNQNKCIIVCVVYRSKSAPCADVDMSISKIIEIQDQISNENKIAYLMGNCKINLLNFVAHQKTNDFTDKVISQRFIPHITKPT